MENRQFRTDKRYRNSPVGDEGRVVSLGGNNGGVEVHSGNGIKKEGVQEGEDMVVIVGTSIMVGMVGQGISTVGHPWFMEKVNVVVSEGEDVMGKVAVDFLGAAVVLKVLVVGEDINNEFGS